MRKGYYININNFRYFSNNHDPSEALTEAIIVFKKNNKKIEEFDFQTIWMHCVGYNDEGDISITNPERDF
jgi:hypothetical protein